MQGVRQRDARSPAKGHISHVEDIEKNDHRLLQQGVLLNNRLLLISEG